MVYYMVGRDAYIIWFYSKHRKKVLYGRLKAGVRDIISTLCRYKDVEIIDGAVCEDYIHLSVTMPLKYSISKFMGYLKDKSTLMIYDRNKTYRCIYRFIFVLSDGSGDKGWQKIREEKI